MVKYKKKTSKQSISFSKDQKTIFNGIQMISIEEVLIRGQISQIEEHVTVYEFEELRIAIDLPRMVFLFVGKKGTNKIIAMTSFYRKFLKKLGIHSIKHFNKIQKEKAVKERQKIDGNYRGLLKRYEKDKIKEMEESFGVVELKISGEELEERGLRPKEKVKKEMI